MLGPLMSILKCKIIKNIRDNRLSCQKNFLPLHHKSPGGGMVDALVSGASVERRAGSSPVLGTIRSKVDTTVSALIFFLHPSRSLPGCKIQEQMQYYKNARLTFFCLSCLFEYNHSQPKSQSEAFTILILLSSTVLTSGIPSMIISVRLSHLTLSEPLTSPPISRL